MVTVGNKIETFAQIVMDKLNGAYAEKEQELEALNQAALKAYHAIAEAKAKQYILDFEAEGKRDAKMLISKAKTSVRNKHIETRQEIYKGLEKSLKEKIAAFTLTEGYSQYLAAAVDKATKEAAKYDGIDIELSKQDYETRLDEVKSLLSARGLDLTKVSFHSIDKGMLGGLIFYNQAHVIRMDYSLDALLEENSRVLGILLSELLDEAGE